MSPDQIQKQLREQTKELPANPVTLKRDVDYDLVYYLRENQAQYPGVSVQHVYVRSYPNGSLAAQIFGYVREVTEEQLKEARYQGLVPGDQVGQSGVENTYDNVLRGVNGLTRVQVDAQGRPTGGVLSQTQPRAGDNLLLTIDSRVQAAGEAALGSFSTPGAFVAMNVRNGEILGLGSSPTYDPSVFTKPVIPQSTIDQIFSDVAGSPYTNRATQGLYPTGSTFKPITAVAALESRVLTPTTTIVDGGTFTIGGLSFQNAGGASYGALQLPEALQVSSDVFFYNLGADLYSHDDAQQQWASELGIGHPTGIDIPGEGTGLLPTPEWRDQLYKEGDTDRPWSVGDNVNLSVGQGDLQTNPLQMAVAYAAIANGGDVVRPHVGMEVEDTSGRAVQEIEPAPQRHVEIAPEHRQAILRGVHMASQSPGGTSYSVFGNFPIPMAGKTGTAERIGQGDQSWYVALAPYPNPEIVVATTIEQGGFGVEAAAPVTCKILEVYYSIQTAGAEGVAKKFRGDSCAGPSTSAGSAYE
jgi:penicillin-binding protein 2